MSFGLPPIKSSPGIQPDDIKFSEGNYGVPDVMTYGLSATRSKLLTSHPLERSEKQFLQNQLRTQLAVLRNTQGLHAPLRLSMELKASQKIGRLPFLPSSNLMRQTLLGEDEEIAFEDFLNTSEFKETMGQPHAIVEKSLGIL